MDVVVVLLGMLVVELVVLGDNDVDVVVVVVGVVEIAAAVVVVVVDTHAFRSSGSQGSRVLGFPEFRGFCWCGVPVFPGVWVSRVSGVPGF